MISAPLRMTMRSTTVPGTVEMISARSEQLGESFKERLVGRSNLHDIIDVNIERLVTYQGVFVEHHFSGAGINDVV